MSATKSATSLAQSQYVETLLPKLIATVVLITLATVVQRRWGQTVGGLVASLPLTSGPLLLYLGLDQGAGFAADAARSSFIELLSFTAYAVGYAHVARRHGWTASLLLALSCFLGCATALCFLRLPAMLTAALLIPVVLLALLRWPKSTADSSTASAAGFADLGLRVSVAVLVTTLVTEAAPLVGPRLAGLFAMLPMLSCVLCASTHHHAGGPAAIAFLRSTVSGLLACLGFFLILLGELRPWGIAPAFALATVAALAIQLVIPSTLNRVLLPLAAGRAPGPVLRRATATAADAPGGADEHRMSVNQPEIRRATRVFSVSPVALPRWVSVPSWTPGTIGSWLGDEGAGGLAVDPNSATLPDRWKADTVARGELRGVVAMDGPSGTGKSTVSKRLAAELGARYLDTGAMYRAVTLAVLRAGIDPTDADAVAAITDAVELVSGTNPRHPTITLDGLDVAAEIRGPEVTAAVSAVSAEPRVRRRLVEQQRRSIAAALVDPGGMVVEGRDIGTVVAPDAALKVYLTATSQARAERRTAQDARSGRSSTVDDTRVDVERRDAFDSGRANSPLRAAEDAVTVDTTQLDIAGVLRKLRAMVDARGLLSVPAPTNR